MPLENVLPPFAACSYSGDTLQTHNAAPDGVLCSLCSTTNSCYKTRWAENYNCGI